MKSSEKRAGEKVVSHWYIRVSPDIPDVWGKKPLESVISAREALH